ncbi:MAG TPA: signal peptidase I [Polyangiaceae bacterium]
MSPTLLDSNGSPIIRPHLQSNARLRDCSTRLWRILQASLWLYLLPAAFVTLIWSYLVVAPALATGSVSEPVSRFANQQPITFAMVSFLSVATVIAYWRNRLRARRRGHAIEQHAMQHHSSMVSVRHNASRSSPQREWLLTTATVLVAGAAAFAFRNYAWQCYSVQGASMLPTFQHGDQLGVKRLATAPSNATTGMQKAPRAIRRGDLVVLRLSDERGERLVKRVVGVPGDRVTMHGHLPVINGWQLPHCDAGFYANLSEGRIYQGRLVVEFLGASAFLTLHSVAPTSFSETYEVQAGEYFVLGDNREESVDSRSWGDGYGAGVPRTRIEGLADWFLVGTHRDGSVDFSRWLKRADLPAMRAEGIDTKTLLEGVERCLRNRPVTTEPPAPSAGGA